MDTTLSFFCRDKEWNFVAIGQLQLKSSFFLFISTSYYQISLKQLSNLETSMQR